MAALPSLVAIFGGVLAWCCSSSATSLRPRCRCRLGRYACTQAGGGMPYGVAIAAGALAVYPLTSWPTLLAMGS